MDFIAMHFSFGFLPGSLLEVSFDLPPWLAPSEVLLGGLLLWIFPLGSSIISCVHFLIQLEVLQVLDYALNRWDTVRLDKLHPWKKSVAYYYCWEKNLLYLIFSPLLSWGCTLCDTSSVPLLVLCIIRLLRVVPTMRSHLVYNELLLLYQVGLMVWGWNQIIQRCEFKLISGKGFLITWAGLDWFFPDVRVCPIIEDYFFVYAAQSRYEVVLEGLNHSLCIFCSFVTWRN